MEMKKDIYSLKINEEFASVTPPLKRCEKEILERDIVRNGCHEPLIVWNGTIIDGHVRYQICREHRIPFAIQEVNFNSESEAIIWIINNQLGRRNLSPFAKCEMVLRFEPTIKGEAKKHMRETISRFRRTGETIETKVWTRQTLANMAGVSGTTLYSVKRILAFGDEEMIRKVRNGEISISYAYNNIVRKPSENRETKATNQDIDLSNIISAVLFLKQKVEAGEASQRQMLEELERISDLLAEIDGGY